MAYSVIPLAVLAFATAAQDVKWVPLNQVNAPPPKVAPATAPAPTPPETASPAPAVTQAPSAAQATQPDAAVPQAASGAQHPLALTCLGAGTANKATSAVAWGWGGWGMIAGHKDRGFNDQVDIRLFTGDDRIRMPRTMLPALHGGDHGWFKVHDLVADARSIRLSAGVGMLNNPKVFIDRVTGTISISGKSGDYAGQCQVIDANAPAKF
jgi:hypothetical protein